MPHVNDPEGRSPSDSRAVSLPPSGQRSHCLAPCEALTLVSRGVRPRTDARAPGVWEGRGLEMVKVRMRTSSGTPTPTVPDTDVYADAQGSPGATAGPDPGGTWGGGSEGPVDPGPLTQCPTEGRRLEPMEAWGETHAFSPPDAERQPRPHGKTEERGRLAADRCTHIMNTCRHHSGYLADDEAGHITYRARVQPPKKPPFLKVEQPSNLGHVPHPPSMYGPSGSSGLRSHRGSTRDPRPFGSFLDFLVEGQVLESLQRVVEEATERMATMKTETGAPLVDVQDPVEMPRGGRRVRARPSLNTVHRHHVQPSLCIGHPNNYPSCSSSMSDSHSNATVGYPGSYGRDSDLGYRGLGPLPPIRDRLLQEKSLKRLLRLENRGKRLPCSQGDALLWDSLGSSLGTPEASELGIGERELKFLKREFNREIKSLLSQSEAFNLPGYSSFREPHRTLDLLAKHHLFPALQSVVNQAVDKLSGALRQNGCPLFPSEWEPITEPNLEITPGSKLATPNPEETTDDLPSTTASSSKMTGRKNKPRTRDKSKEGGSTMSNAQGATRFRLQSPHYNRKKMTLPSISSKSISCISNPWSEELINDMTEQAVSLLVCKYKFERNLTKQLGLISFPITETLVDLLLGFKKVKGSNICLSSEVNWNDLLRMLEEAQWARHVSLEASQHDASQRTASLPGSIDTPSILSMPATVLDQVAEEPGPQLPNLQEKGTAEEHKPTNQLEPKPSASQTTGTGFKQPEQVVDMGEKQ
ncbi:coiled-coil domain-containing protein 116, partial [Myotis daubentonii]|uniref:coiled-coil domain-containing protein 116 n=1 Tax=Myotis daubentonii TaxID=98922 RepID=UPI002873CC31